ncbi:hypothetical protein BU24DRAFT_426754 [Aaosphaeria arxii CBS 175.79]|uniref:Large ribosomal subunit protein mL49 n=1 Tax=Aaosphaeria arxii CBS 175.79 TaxID=1450172 RepID=A0A6A5XEZ4_9PLEO|nr:uncharacterized protein BU24DRAFT_426754 [Aaosphaeria arxii CBS 175.79]KAF2011672.1 hypothetical protein BU24DRAFT_426754 [Aaosphaeria arxii CBS 175.79]
MSRIQPIMAFLRPAVAPRSAIFRPMMRFSSAARFNAEEPATPAKSPSTKAPPPPSSPKEAARAADLAAAEALTDGDSAQAPAPKPVLPSDHTNPSQTTAQTDSVPVSSGRAAASNIAQVSKPKAQTSKTAKENKATSTPQSTTTLELPPAKYHVERSKSGNLPVYQDYKRGGNLHLTTIRKITGDRSALRDELRVLLGKKDEDVKINQLTKHVTIKGHHRAEVLKFLELRVM